MSPLSPSSEEGRNAEGAIGGWLLVFPESPYSSWKSINPSSSSLALLQVNGRGRGIMGEPEEVCKRISVDGIKSILWASEQR